MAHAMRQDACALNMHHIQTEHITRTCNASTRAHMRACVNACPPRALCPVPPALPACNPGFLYMHSIGHIHYMQSQET